MKVSEIIKKLQNYQDSVGDVYIRRFLFDLPGITSRFQMNCSLGKKTKNGDPALMSLDEYRKLNEPIIEKRKKQNERKNHKRKA